MIEHFAPTCDSSDQSKFKNLASQKTKANRTVEEAELEAALACEGWTGGGALHKLVARGAGPQVRVCLHLVPLLEESKNLRRKHGLRDAFWKEKPAAVGTREIELEGGDLDLEILAHAVRAKDGGRARFGTLPSDFLGNNSAVADAACRVEIGGLR